MRVNTAAELLADGMTVIDATVSLARRHRLSERQARRYVERTGKNHSPRGSARL